MHLPVPDAFEHLAWPRAFREGFRSGARRRLEELLRLFIFHLDRFGEHLFAFVFEPSTPGGDDEVVAFELIVGSQLRVDAECVDISGEDEHELPFAIISA